MRKPNRAELIGRVFGRLTAVAEAEKDGKCACWLCICICGNKKIVRAANLLNGNTQSCGCLQRERASETARTHGDTNSTEHRIWMSMHSRCSNKGDPGHKSYGGRGITVCARWSGPEGYQHFLEDMGRRPGPGYSIDRQNNDLGYSPENCVWATVLEQARNKRSNRMLTLNGRSMCLAAWAEYLHIPSSRIYRRLASGLPLEQVLTSQRIARSAQKKDPLGLVAATFDGTLGLL
jgi:hypothetical protein